MTTLIKYMFTDIGKVVTTGPDRPVEPGTGPISGPVDTQNRFADEPE
jgi:hypothetical protein